MSEQSNTSKLVKGMSSQTLVTLINGTVEIVTFSILSRLLSKEDFGYFASITAITLVLHSFAEAGIGSAIIQNKNADERYINSAFTLSIIFGGVIAILLGAFSFPLANLIADTTIAIPLLVMSTTMLFGSMSSVFISIMHKQLYFLRVGLINLVALLFTNILSIILAIKGFGLYAIVSKSVLYSFLVLVLSFIFVKCSFKLQVDKKSFKQIWSFTSWLMASSVIRNLSQQIDKLMMPRIMSIEMLGAYNRPKDFISNIATRINGIFDTALFPVLSNVQDNKKTMYNALNKSIGLLNIFGVLISFIFIINARLIVRVFFGSQWFELIPLFQIMSIYFMLNLNGRLMDCFLRSLGLTKSQFYFRTIQLVITIVAMIIGSYYGIIGIGSAIVGVYVVMNTIKLWFVSRNIGLAFSMCLKGVIGSFKFLIVVAPLSILFSFLVPKSIIGEIIILFLSISMLMIEFVYAPSTVGELYKVLVYPKIQNIINRLLFKK